jgi:hypothetical protein
MLKMKCESADEVKGKAEDEKLEVSDRLRV